MIRRSKSTFFAIGVIAAEALVADAARAEDPCTGPVAAATTEGTADDVFARGRAELDAKRLPEAASILRAAALDHADDAVATKAALLSLEAMSRIAAGTNLCLPTMATDTDKYLATLCATPRPGIDRAEDCRSLRAIARSALRLDGETTLMKAQKEKGETRRRLARRAADVFMQAWGTEAEACKQHRTSECTDGDELLYDASVSLAMAEDAGQAHAVRAILFDPAYGLDKTPIARRAMFEHAVQLSVLTEFDRAASFFERYANESPDAEHAAAALEDAMILRVGLGQHALALASFEKLQKLFGKKLGDRLERITLQLAKDLVEGERWADAEKLLRGLGRAKSPLVRFHAQSLLAETLLARKKGAEAEKLFESLAHARPGDLVEVSTGTQTGDVMARYDFAELAVAVGRARLHLADEARDAALGLEVKKGQSDSLKKKLEAIERAETAYRSVLDLEPFPPPAEVVSAARRIARMHAQVWGQAYLALGKDAAEPLERRALAAHSTCADMAVKYEVATPEARACFEWLERHDPAHHPPLREIFAHARFQEAFDSHPTPLARDGLPVVETRAGDETTP